MGIIIPMERIRKRMEKKEYIEREAAYSLAKKVCEAVDSNPRVLLPRIILDLIDDLPAADVRPVVRGKWVKARGSWCTPGGDPVWECSECGKGRHVYGIEHGSYGADVADGQWVACPNCGADMREES